MKKTLLLFVTLLFLFYIQSSYAGCAACDGINVCGDDYCCGVSDGICPSEYGDWLGVSNCTQQQCQTFDPDCCSKEECDYTNATDPDCDGVCSGSTCYDGENDDNDFGYDFCEGMPNGVCF